MYDTNFDSILTMTLLAFYIYTSDYLEVKFSANSSIHKPIRPTYQIAGDGSFESKCR